MRRLIPCLLFLAASSCFASQPPVAGGGGNEDPSGSNIFEELNRQLKVARKPDSAEGFGPVSAKASRVCEICKQPLYKHSQEGFECIPLNADGEQRKMLRIKTRGAQCP